MLNKEKRIRPLWAVLSAVALAVAVLFSVLTGYAAGISKKDSGLSVPLAGGAPVTAMAENGAYLAAADESGVVSCYDKPTDRLLWQTSKKLSDGETNAVVKSLAIRDGCVYAAFEDKSVMRFAAADGIVQGVVSTNYIPENMIFSSGSSSLFAVYGKTGTKREVYLFRTDFAGSEASPVSWREYPKLDAGEYAVSSGGVETGVQGIFVSDEYVYVASDMYTVRRFSHEGMAEPYEEFSTKAEKLVCFYEVADGFAGVDLRGNFYRMDASFSTRFSLSSGRSFDTVRRAGDMFYGVSNGVVTGISSSGEKLYTLSAKGSELVLAKAEGFAVSGDKGVKYYANDFAASMEGWSSKTGIFAVALAVSLLFLVYAGLSVYRPVQKRVNHAFVCVGKTFVKHRFAYLGLIPAFALLAVFYYWPIIQGFALSFFNYNGVTKVFVGLQNFKDVLHNTIFWSSTGNMFIFLVTDLLKALIPPFFFAEFILAVKNKKFSFAVRVLLFVPGILPGVAGTLVWVNGIFGSDGYGLLNSICSLFVPGFVQTWIGPYLESRSLISLIMFGLPWVGSYLIFYGGVMGIPKSLFEAAELDGCGWWRRMFTIDLPLIFSQLKYIFITSFIASVQDYGRLFITDQSTGHGLKIPALLIYEYIYKGGSEPNYGLSSAMSMFLFAFLLIATILNFRKQKDDAK